MGIQVEEAGQLTIATPAQLERLQSGIQAALLLVQQTVEQQDGGLHLFRGDLQHRGRQELHGTARQQLPSLDGGIDRRVQIPAGNDLARNSSLLGQLMEGILHGDMQHGSQFIGEVSPRGTMNESLCGRQQSAEPRKPDLCLRPQSVIVKAGDFAEGIVSAAVGIAGEVIQQLEFAEDRDVNRRAKGVPIKPGLLFGTITNPRGVCYRPSSTEKTKIFGRRATSAFCRPRISEGRL